MPKVKQSSVNVSKMFWLNGLEYQKGNWGVYYRNVIIDPDTNQIDEDQLLVGIRELNSHSNILVTPVPIGSWVDGNDVPYTSLTTLLTDLAGLLGFSVGGASPQIQNVTNYSALPAPNLATGGFYWVENSQGIKYIGAIYGGTYYPVGLYYSNGVSWIYMDTPFQATLSEVDTGTITDRFVTPNTLSNSTWAFTVDKVRNTLLTGLSFVSSRITSLDTILSAFGKLQRQTSELQSTRFTSGVGVSINADNTKFDIQAAGVIVDPITFDETPINVSLTGITATYIATQPESYIWINSSGSVVQSLTPPSPLDIDSIIGYWVLVHSNLTNITVINSFPYYAEGLATKLAQLFSFIGFRKFKDTNVVSAGTTGTRISHTGGLVLKAGIGNTTKRPVISLNGAIDTTLRMRNRTQGSEGADTQTLDVTNIDVAGVTTTLGNNKFGAHKVWKFSSSLIRVQRGQREYANIDAAKTGIKTDTFVNEGNAERNGIHIGWVIFKKGTSWGTGGTGVEGIDYLFVDEIQSASAGTSAVTLQGAYNNSSQPQFQITDAKGSLDFKSDRASNSSRVLRGFDNTNTETWWINADGTSSFLPNLSLLSDATLPLSNTDELLVNQGGIWKKVDKSEFGGASKRTINFDYQFGGVLSTATTNWWTSTSNGGGIAFSSLAQLASLTPTNNFANLPVQFPGHVVPYACRLKSITVKCFSNSGSGNVDLAVVSGTYAGSGSTLINTTILSNQIFNIHTYLGISNFSETLQVLETGFTNYVIPKGYEIRMCLNNKNVAKNLLGCTISIEFEEEI